MIKIQIFKLKVYSTSDNLKNQLVSQIAHIMSQVEAFDLFNIIFTLMHNKLLLFYYLSVNDTFGA